MSWRLDHLGQPPRCFDTEAEADTAADHIRRSSTTARVVVWYCAGEENA